MVSDLLFLPFPSLLIQKTDFIKLLICSGIQPTSRVYICWCNCYVFLNISKAMYTYLWKQVLILCTMFAFLSQKVRMGKEYPRWEEGRGTFQKYCTLQSRIEGKLTACSKQRKERQKQDKEVRLVCLYFPPWVNPKASRGIVEIFRQV